MKKKYTSLELSKKLHENGCEIQSGIMVYDKYDETGYVSTREQRGVRPVFSICPAYDILNDICVRYAKEFFPPKIEFNGDINSERHIRITAKIFRLIQENEKQEAEDYIWKHCLFNPKNKK